jgi:hypothetical protein
MTMMQMYWLTRFDSLVCLFAILFWLSIVASLFCVVAWAVVLLDKDAEMIEFWRRNFIVLVCVSAITLPPFMFLPSSKEMAAIILVPKILNNASVQAMPDKITALAGEWMEELRPKNVKETAKQAVEEIKKK